MIREHPMRAYYVTVAIVAVLSITIGLVVANLTGQYVAVFIAQMVIAAVLVTQHPRVKKRSGSAE